MEIIQALDTNLWASQIKVFALQYADATELVDVSKICLKKIRSHRVAVDPVEGAQAQALLRFLTGSALGENSEKADEVAVKAAAAQAKQVFLLRSESDLSCCSLADERTNSLVVSAAEETMP